MTTVWYIVTARVNPTPGWQQRAPLRYIDGAGPRARPKGSSVFSKAPDLIVTSHYTRAKQQRNIQSIAFQTYDRNLEHARIQLSIAARHQHHGRAPSARAGLLGENDPAYIDDVDAESFENFISRVQTMQAEIQKRSGFITIFGHGFFMKACSGRT